MKEDRRVMRDPVIRRRNRAALPWLRATAFAAVTYLALTALGFYPAAVPPVLAIAIGALGLLSPSIGILVFLTAVGIPLLAANIVAGALFLVLGFGIIQYLGESNGRAFLIITLAFAATLVKAEWGVAVLAGYLLGASDGAVVAFVACLLIQSTGLLLGSASIGLLATGGTTPVVDLGALSQIQDPLRFGWFLPSLSRIDPSGLLKAVTQARDLALLGIQPLLWAGAAAVAGLLRKPAGSPLRRVWTVGAVGVAVLGLAALSAVASLALGGPARISGLATGALLALVVALAVAVASEWVFAPEVAEPERTGTSAEDADVDDLLRMISTAEEQLASKHTVRRTVLITDMKAFSRMTQELGSTETARLVQRHRDLLIPLIEKAGGKGKSTGGDGLLAAFETPASAIRATVEMQQALFAYNASRPGEEAVLIRAGIASGEVVLDKGGKPFLGDALNLAARVMSLADGGQVFTTGEDAASGGTLTYGSVSHGEFRLKNIATPVDIVEVLWSADQQGRAPHPAPLEG
jgi:class 3 adenylate cyclase